MKIGISEQHGLHICHLGGNSLQEVEECARRDARTYGLICNPAWDANEVIEKRATILEERESIGGFVKVAPNRWQHEKALAAVAEGYENTYATYSTRDLAMRFYSIDK